MFTETRSRVEDSLWGEKGFWWRSLGCYVVLVSVRKAAGDLKSSTEDAEHEEKDKEAAQVFSKETREIEDTV